MTSELKEKEVLRSRYNSMIQRCENPKNDSYKNYGGRGIVVCERWRKDYYKFEEDMISTYKSGLTLERIDINGNYSPDNCKWATNEEQQKNRTDNVFLTLGDQTKTVRDWAKTMGISDTTIHTRLAKGWSHDKILNTPTQFKKEIKDEVPCKRCGVKIQRTNRKRIYCSRECSRRHHTESKKATKNRATGN